MARRLRRRAMRQTAGVTPAAFPSRLSVASNHIVDENGYDLGVLKGFNVNVASTVGSEGFVFSQNDYTAMAAIGAKIVRHVLHWNVFEQSSNTFHATALSSLDTAIGRAGTAGMYTLLELHINATGDPATGSVPTWARTGTSPSGSGNEWTWLCTNAQNFIEELADRYKDNKHVVGFNPNEPTDTSIPNIQTGYATIVPWYRAIAPMWPIWCSATAYGNGTPYPTSGTQINTTNLLALDTNNRGVIFEHHDYYETPGSGSTNGYQANGAIDPIEQVPTTGSHYHGFSSTRNSARSGGRTTAYAAHYAWAATLRAVSPRIALAVCELGRNNLLSNHDEQIEDKINSYRAAGACVEIWWQYGTATTNFDSGTTANGGGGFRTAISGSRWMTNPTARA